MKKTSCIIVDDEAVAREILENYVERVADLDLLASCNSAMEAFKSIGDQQVDLIFLDISMPEMDGLTFAKNINPGIKIIFTTAHREYALEGFDLQAVDYLLKPISFDRFLQAVKKFQGELPGKKAEEETMILEERSDYLFVRADRKMVRINFPDLIMIESLGDYLKIHLKQQVVVTRETMGTIEGKLPAKDFIRVHRSYLVALKEIASFTNEYVEVRNQQIPISRGQKEKVLKLLEK